MSVISRQEIEKVYVGSVRRKQYNEAFWEGYSQACADLIAFLEKADKEGLEEPAGKALADNRPPVEAPIPATPEEDEPEEGPEEEPEEEEEQLPADVPPKKPERKVKHEFPYPSPSREEEQKFKERFRKVLEEQDEDGESEPLGDM